MGLFGGKQKIENIKPTETTLRNNYNNYQFENIKPTETTLRNNYNNYQFDRYKVISDMVRVVAKLQDTDLNRALYQRLDDCYYQRNGNLDGKIRLSDDELVLIRRLLGSDNGSIGEIGHQARVELDSILSNKGIQWRTVAHDTNVQHKIQGGGKYLRTHLEVMNSKALSAPVITSLPDITSILSTPITLQHSAEELGIPTAFIGILAFRCWGFRDGFLVSSGKGNALWKEVMYSDEAPRPDSGHGIYATKLSAYTALRKTWEFVDPICGLVRLRGKVVEHRDGILRAEFASIARIFVIPAWVSSDTLIEQVIREIKYNYPNIPLDILLPEQLATILVAIVSRMETE